MKEYQVIITAVIIALGAIFSTALFTSGVIKYQKLQNQTITVTGSASKTVTSDFAKLNINFKCQSPTLKGGYNLMNANKEKIKNFLVKEGFSEKDIEFGQLSNYEVNKREGSFTTNQIDFYRFNSSAKVSSNNIELIKKVADKVDSLVNQDIEVDYSNVEYYVSDLDKIKIEMVGEATKNAKERASSMVKSTNDKIGSLNSAKMGVFQIVPVNSTEVSDYGINDTSSIEKKVVAVVNATFTVK